jgi:endo-1,4-beta-xylanase
METKKTPRLALLQMAKIGVFSAILVTGCTTTGSGSENQKHQEQKMERTLATAYEPFFPVGVAVAAGEYGFNSFTAYGDPLIGEFNSLVAENCMKSSVIHPAEGLFNWGPADSIVNYAQKHNMRVRGHTLVCHNQSAPWMFPGTGTAEEKKEYSRSKMQEHINAVVGRYKGKIYCWDVVNEAVKDNGDTSASIYRESSPWYTAFGDASCIQDAFDYAANADPEAELFYNDYSICDSNKRNRVVKMINTLNLEQHGLKGIGIQAHWNLVWPTISDIQTTIDTFHSMGLDVQITELDIDCYDGSASGTTLPYSQFESKLAERYKEIFDCFRKNKGKISGVTFWGLADDHTWLDNFYGGSNKTSPRKNYPLLFGTSHQFKKAFYAVRDF